MSISIACRTNIMVYAIARDRLCLEKKHQQQAKLSVRDEFNFEFLELKTSMKRSDWKSQNVISNKEKMGLRKPPNVFTEQDVAIVKRAQQRNSHRSEYTDHQNLYPHKTDVERTY